MNIFHSLFLLVTNKICGAMERVLAVFVSGQQVGRGAHPHDITSSSSRIGVKRLHLAIEYNTYSTVQYRELHTYIHTYPQ